MCIYIYILHISHGMYGNIHTLGTVTHTRIACSKCKLLRSQITNPHIEHLLNVGPLFTKAKLAHITPITTVWFMVFITIVTGV